MSHNSKICVQVPFDLKKGIPVKFKCLRGDGASLNKNGQVYFDRLSEADCLSDTGIGGSG